MSYPNGVYASSDGRSVGDADSNNNRVSVWRKGGGQWRNQAIFGGEGSGPGQLRNPTRLTVAPAGQTAWVADTNKNRISVWMRDGSSWANHTTFGTQADYVLPTGMSVTDDGRTVLVADNRSHSVSEWRLVETAFRAKRCSSRPTGVGRLPEPGRRPATGRRATDVQPRGPRALSLPCVHSFGSRDGCRRRAMEYTEPTPEERQELLIRWRRAYTAFRDALSDMSDEELDELAREVTEEVDDAIRQEAIRLRRRAS